MVLSTTGWLNGERMDDQEHRNDSYPIPVIYDKPDLSGVITAATQYIVPPGLDDVQVKTVGTGFLAILPEFIVSEECFGNIPEE